MSKWNNHRSQGGVLAPATTPKGKAKCPKCGKVEGNPAYSAGRVTCVKCGHKYKWDGKR